MLERILGFELVLRDDDLHPLPRHLQQLLRLSFLQPDDCRLSVLRAAGADHLIFRRRWVSVLLDERGHILGKFRDNCGEQPGLDNLEQRIERSYIQEQWRCRRTDAVRSARLGL